MTHDTLVPDEAGLGPDGYGPRRAELAATLRQLRLNAKLGVRPLAEACNLRADGGHVSNVERGTSHPSDNLVYDWVRACVPGEDHHRVYNEVRELWKKADAEQKARRADTGTKRRATARPRPDEAVRAALPSSADAATSADTGYSLVASLLNFSSHPLTIGHLVVRRTYCFEHDRWWRTSTRFEFRFDRPSPAPRPAIFQIYEPESHNVLRTPTQGCEAKRINEMPGVEDPMLSTMIGLPNLTDLGDGSTYECWVDFQQRQELPRAVADIFFTVGDPAAHVDSLVLTAEVVAALDHEESAGTAAQQPEIIERKTYSNVAPGVSAKFRVDLPWRK